MHSIELPPGTQMSGWAGSLTPNNPIDSRYEVILKHWFLSEITDG